MSTQDDDNRETIGPPPTRQSGNHVHDIDDDDDIPELPSLPSLTQSTSETEEERRRILEGIFAEEDDDDDDGEEDVLAFLGGASSSSHQQQQQQQRGHQEKDGGVDDVVSGDGATAGAVSNDVVHNVSLISTLNLNNDSSRNVENEHNAPPERDAHQSANATARVTTTDTTGTGNTTQLQQQQQQQQQQQHASNATHLVSPGAQSRMQRISECAFSSSSDDDGSDDDDEEDGFFHSALAEPVLPAVVVTTPKFSNATAKEKGTNEFPGAFPHQQQQQQQQPDLEDAYTASSADPNFSWIHSIDSGSIDVDDATAEEEEQVRGQDTLSFDFSQDTESLAASKSPPSMSPSASLSSGVNVNANVNATATSRGGGGDAATTSSSSSHQHQQQDQHQQQQSAFDRALNEVQQSGGRSAKLNSFSFSKVGSPVEAATVTAGANTPDAEVAVAAGATATTMPKQTAANDDDASQGAEATPSSMKKAADDDDFFAKAEHTVLDEIFSENFVGDEEESTSGNEKKREDSSSPKAKRAGKLTGSASSNNNSSSRIKDRISLHTNNSANNNNSGRNNNNSTPKSPASSQTSSSSPAAGLPDVLGAMRQKIESSLPKIFDGESITSSVVTNKSSIAPAPLSSNNNNNNNLPNINQQPTNMLIMDAASSTAPATLQRYYSSEEERESMRRAFQQSISAAVLVSLAHKRYERRRLAAMEIEKVVRSLVVQEDYPRVRAILLLLSDDYVRSTNEDARKGGAVALAACAIGLKKADEGRRDVAECRDLILASVVHACQDHSQRVRYYATESLFNVTKVIPSLAVQHFFILFEILRSLYADVDLDVRSGAELLDKKLKEVIVGAINSGSFSADACVPVFARFVYMRNKATKQLTLTWLKEFSEKLIGAPILQFLHLFLGGIFAMVADPNAAIRQLALEFLQSVLPKLLVNNEDFEDSHAQQNKVDFDKILQSLVLTMEHPDPFVRKVAMYWMSRIVQAHMSGAFPSAKMGDGIGPNASLTMGGGSDSMVMKGGAGIIGASLSSDLGRTRGGGGGYSNSAASVSVRNALPHVLPGILLSIGDTHQSRSKDSFLPDQTTHSLAEQANTCLQDAVRRDGRAFIPHLGGFIVALREELDSPGGLIARNPPSLERRPYRMDVKADGSGIESTGWFRASDGVEERDNALILSRLCALQWVVVLYEHVVPNSLKSEYASEFIDCIIYQLVDQPPGIIIVKSFEVLAKISNPAEGEASYALFTSKTSLAEENTALLPDEMDVPSSRHNPMTDENANFALGIILDPSRKKLLSRDRSVFASLIDLHSKHQKLLMDISKVIELMCTLQPPEFVFVSFAYELDNFIVSRLKHREKILESPDVDGQKVKQELASFAKDLAFVSNFAQQLGIVFFAAPETEQLRAVLKDSIGFKGDTLRDERKARLFHILLYTFSHNIVATLAFCLWGGAFLTASTFLQNIDSLDVSLMFYLEIDQLIDLIERPLFRHLHLRMLECEDDPYCEGSGAMLFRTLKSIIMLLPQSTSYMILKERLTSMARYRQSAVALSGLSKNIDPGSETDVFVKRIVNVRRLHCDAKWRNIRAESLEEPCRDVGEDQKLSAAQQRREWLGYADEEDELMTKERIKQNMLGENTAKKVEMVGVYENFNELAESMPQQQLAQHKNGNEDECEQCVVTSPTTKGLIKRFEQMSDTGDEEKEDQSSKPQWREYWASRQ